MPKIVISYRREDTAGITGRIHDRLCDHYGRDAVFRDIDAIPLGVDFRKHLEQVLNDADAMVCVIGENWIGKSGRGARRAAPGSRISDPADYVRLEVESALQKDIPIVPVLIDNAPMPKRADLPESLHALMFRQALTVNQLQDFDVHTRRLIDGLDRTLGASVQTQAPVPQPSPGTREASEAGARPARSSQDEAPRGGNNSRMIFWAILGLCGALAVLLITVWPQSPPQQSSPPQQQLPPQTQSSQRSPAEGPTIGAPRTAPQTQSLGQWTEALKANKITEEAPNFFSASLCSGCGPASFYCVQPIRSVSELKGRKIRIAGTDLDLRERLTSAGAIPMIMPLAETYQALTARVIDCVGAQEQ
jgi:hypothetical protein